MLSFRDECFALHVAYVWEEASSTGGECPARNWRLAGAHPASVPRLSSAVAQSVL